MSGFVVAKRDVRAQTRALSKQAHQLAHMDGGRCIRGFDYDPAVVAF
jgi:hypothetical protein